MSDSSKLQLPYLDAGQAQKHVTVNDALSRLDVLVQLKAVSRVATAPPGVAVDGTCYLLPAAPTGAWAGQAGKLAMSLAGSWVFLTPQEGFHLWVDDEDVFLVFNGSTWSGFGAPTALQNLTLLGVNATADATNKLTVSAAATLFNHAGSGHQIKVNKGASADTASFVFQTSYSGRAEFGTTGDDAFHLKISADGSTFTEVLVADAAADTVSLPRGLKLPARTTPAAPVNGQFWLDASSNRLRVQENGTAKNLTPDVRLGHVLARHLIMN
jgi:Protein of unknown function (DUF2793)